MKKKTTVIFLAIIMALTIMPLSATAASTTTVSKGLITSKDAKGPGYNWDASKHTLTLNNANILNKSRSMITLNNDYHVTIIVKGNNTLTGIDSISSLIDRRKSTTSGVDNNSKYSLTRQRNLTIKGDGTLTINGIIYPHYTNLIVNGAKLNIITPQNVNWNSINFTRGLVLKNGAKVYVNKGINNDKDLIIDNSTLIAASALENTPGNPIDNTGDITVENKGILKAYTTGEKIASAGDRSAILCNNIIADDTTIFEARCEGPIAIDSLQGKVSILSRKINISAEEQAVRCGQKQNPALLNLQLPKQSLAANGGKYTIGTYTVESGNDIRYYCTVYDGDNMAKSVIYEDPQVTAAEKAMAAVRLKAYSKSYAKTKTKQLRMKVWWEQTQGEKQKVTGYEIAKSSKRNGTYKIMFSASKTQYINTAGLKKGNRYYYKVRAYSKVRGIRYYSSWSNITYKIAR